MSDTSSQNDLVADAIRHSWVYQLPRAVWPYAQLARWERPIGWKLLMWPCLWALALVFQQMVDRDAVFFGYHCILFAMGAFFMRGAGCTYNDLVDKDIDSKVARTKSRPLPSGRVNRRQAAVFLIVQAFGGLAVLIAISHHMFTFFLGLASLALVAIYPFMKRITWWPQFFLGLAFSYGALMGWSAFADGLAIPPVLLYLGCIAWVIGYDTVYAHQDIEDDALIGVKSTARLFAGRTRPILAVLYGCAILLWTAALVSAGVGILAFMGLAAAIIHMVWQVIRLDIHNTEQCLATFKSNDRLGFIFFAGLTLEAFV